MWTGGIRPALRNGRMNEAVEGRRSSEATGWSAALVTEVDERVDVLGRNSYSSGMKATVSEKGQVTIPKPLRDRLGIRRGQVLEFRAERGQLIASKAAPEDAVEAVFGILKLGASTDDLIDELRGPAEPR
jgi:antitoxin PrlF